MASFDGKTGTVIFKVYFKATVTGPYRQALQIVRKFYSIPGLETLGWENFDNKIILSQSKNDGIKVIVKDEGTLAIGIYKAFYNNQDVLKISLKYSKDSLATLIDILHFLGVLNQDYKIKKAPNDFIDL